MGRTLDTYLSNLELHQMIDKHRLYIIYDKHIQSFIDSTHKKQEHIS